MPCSWTSGLRQRRSVSKSCGLARPGSLLPYDSEACAVPFRYVGDGPDQVQLESSQRGTTPVCRE
jgi:hypothetical protein